MLFYIYIFEAMVLFRDVFEVRLLVKWRGEKNSRAWHLTTQITTKLLQCCYCRNLKIYPRETMLNLILASQGTMINPSGE